MIPDEKPEQQEAVSKQLRDWREEPLTGKPSYAEVASQPPVGQKMVQFMSEPDMGASPQSEREKTLGEVFLDTMRFVFSDPDLKHRVLSELDATDKAQAETIARAVAAHAIEHHPFQKQLKLMDEVTATLRDRLTEAEHGTQAKDAEIARLKLCLEPGKASAIVNGVWKIAERLGMPHSSWKHALTWLGEEIERLRAKSTQRDAENAALRGLVDECGKCLAFTRGLASPHAWKRIDDALTAIRKFKEENGA
jgi:hypothetical protein